MKKVIGLTSIVLLTCISAFAQTVNSGSTGADGVFRASLSPQSTTVPPGTTVNCSGGTILLPAACTFVVPLREPPNHILNFTTVTIDAGVIVLFARNKANTPVFILAQGDVNISGFINVSAGGSTPGPGGFSGGIGGAGNGPGGGSVSSNGAFGTGPGAYGTPELQPLIGGSGGGSLSNPVAPGPPGGGALLIASSGTIDVGSGSGPAIYAMGEQIVSSGSGGAIRLSATLLRGSRSLVAEAFQSTQSPGRIRLESAQPTQFSGITSPTPTYNPPGQPIVIFPPITPTLRIVSIGGVALPAQPTVEPLTPDLTLPPNNPVSIVLEATNVPSGTQAKVIINPQYNSGTRIITAPLPLTGAIGLPKRATFSLDLPPSGVGIISAIIDLVTPEP